MRPFVHVFTEADFDTRKSATNIAVRRLVRARELRLWLSLAIARAAVIVGLEMWFDADRTWWIYGAIVWSAYTFGSFLRHTRDLA